MASSLLRKGAAEIRRTTAALKRLRDNKREETDEAMGLAAAGAGAAAVALADKKFGENGEAYKFHKIPVGGVAGAATAVTAIVWRKMPGRKLVGMLGIGAMCGGLYKAVFDAVEFEP